MRASSATLVAQRAAHSRSARRSKRTSHVRPATAAPVPPSPAALGASGPLKTPRPRWSAPSHRQASAARRHRPRRRSSTVCLRPTATSGKLDACASSRIRPDALVGLAKRKRSALAYASASGAAFERLIEGRVLARLSVQHLPGPLLREDEVQARARARGPLGTCRPAGGPPPAGQPPCVSSMLILSLNVSGYAATGREACDVDLKRSQRLMWSAAILSVLSTVPPASLGESTTKHGEKKHGHVPW